MKPSLHMKAPLQILAVVGITLGVSVLARADIVVRLSVKAVLDPATGARQTNVTEQVFSNTIAGMNEIMATFGRGYRYEWVGNRLIDVGGLGQTNAGSGPSYYFDQDLTEDGTSNGGVLNHEFETNAMANPTLYGWDFTAVNLYIVRMGGRQSGSITWGNHIFLLGNAPPGRGYGRVHTVIHEVGHHFSLKHTHEGELYENANHSPCTNRCACARLIGGTNDLIADTIADHECWNSQDDIAQGNYLLNYADLTNPQKAAVDRVWMNIMSYHDGQGTNEANIFTSDQLDRWTDSANSDRSAEVSGLTHFVDRNNGCIAPVGSSACQNNVGGPLTTLAGGIAFAVPGDIVLVRVGHYNEPMTIRKAITLRATRGNVLLGKP